MSSEVHGAAARALDAQDNQRTIGIADELLLDIAAGNVAQQVSDKSVLPDVDVAQNMTVRHDPKEILAPTPHPVHSPSVPLPVPHSTMDLDELDV